MSYTPSKAATEVVARAQYDILHGDWRMPDGQLVSWDRTSEIIREGFRERSAAALGAFMGASVPAEPCATCGGDRVIDLPPERWVAEGGSADCPDCPPPRSLPVVECEAAGLLVEVGEDIDDIPYDETPLFREAAPSTGSPTAEARPVPKGPWSP